MRRGAEARTARTTIAFACRDRSQKALARFCSHRSTYLSRPSAEQDTTKTQVVTVPGSTAVQAVVECNHRAVMLCENNSTWQSSFQAESVPAERQRLDVSRPSSRTGPASMPVLPGAWLPRPGTGPRCGPGAGNHLSAAAPSAAACLRSTRAASRRLGSLSLRGLAASSSPWTPAGRNIDNSRRTTPQENNHQGRNPLKTLRVRQRWSLPRKTLDEAQYILSTGSSASGPQRCTLGSRPAGSTSKRRLLRGDTRKVLQQY